MIPVLFIAYYFPPIGGAGVQRSQKFVDYLPSRGFQPIVLTGPKSADDRWAPVTDEGETMRCPIYRAVGPVPRANGSLRSKLGNWFGFEPAFSRWWIQSACQAAPQSLDGARLIFATMSPFSSSLVAQKLSQRAGIPWVADLRDPWALDEMQAHPTGIHRRVELKRMGNWLASAAGIVMNTPEATNALHAAFPALQNKPVVTITNGYDEADFKGEPTPRTDGKFSLVHTGYLHTGLGLKLQKRGKLYQFLGGMTPGLDVLTRSHVVLLQAVERWLTRRPEVANDLQLVFAGVTSPADQAVVQQSPLAPLVHFTGYLSHRDSVSAVRTADLLFLPMHNLPAPRRSRIVPGKTYEYMRAGRPILAAVPEGDARDFLQKSGVALCCRPDDVEGMVGHLDSVYSAWKKRTSVIQPDWNFIAGFDREALTEKLADFFTQILRSPQP